MGEILQSIKKVDMTSEEHKRHQNTCFPWTKEWLNN